MSGSAESRNHQPRGATAHDETWHHALRVLANAPGTPLPTLDRRLTWMSAIRNTRILGRHIQSTEAFSPATVSLFPAVTQARTVKNAT
jgi:hypothetical protein